MKKTIITCIIACLFYSGNTVWAQAPQGYYDLADQKRAGELKTAMHTIIKNHIRLEYYTSSAYFRYNTDWHPDGYFWDMYSNNKRTSFNGMNREHNMPKSWWSADPAGTVAYSDLHNLYPSDAEANGAKSNYALGEVGSVSYSNGVVKVGQNIYSTVYQSAVFEPADEYKGDFARDYFYMVTCYQDYASSWRSTGTLSMLNNELYPTFKTWAIEMLLKWSRQDPVSQKEIDRNNAVFELQQNRNPFIDYPDLAEYIWGNKTSQLFTVNNKAESPALITPTNDISVDFGQVLSGETAVRELPVRGKGLSGSMSVLLLSNASGYFSRQGNSISTSYINSDNGYQYKVSYAPTSLGQHTAKLVFLDGGFAGSVNIAISGECVSTLHIDNEMMPETAVYAANGYIRFKGIEEGSFVEIYAISGQKVMSFDLSGDELYFDKKGIYFVKIGRKVYKIIF
ncbi:endonuclease [Viscerimonas tarda]